MSRYTYEMSLMIFILLVLVVCAVALFTDKMIREFERWAERRAVKQREREKAKREADARKWGLVPFYPTKSRYIPKEDLDPSHTTKQFKVPTSLRDYKARR